MTPSGQKQATPTARTSMGIASILRSRSLTLAPASPAAQSVPGRPKFSLTYATMSVAPPTMWQSYKDGLMFDMDSGWQALLHFDPYLMSQHWKPSSGTYLQEPRLEIFPRRWVKWLLIEVDLLLVQSGCHPQRGGRERVVVQGDV